MKKSRGVAAPACMDLHIVHFMDLHIVLYLAYAYDGIIVLKAVRALFARSCTLALTLFTCVNSYFIVCAEFRVANVLRLVNVILV